MDQTIAWAAGFIDGEGHVGIHVIKDRRVGTIRAPRLNPRVVVGQVSVAPLERLRDTFGGSLHRRSKFDVARRPIWVWETAGARNTALTLRAVRPLLVVKHADADIVLELCDRILAWRQGCRLTDDEVDARNEIAARLVGSRGSFASVPTSTT